MHHAMKAYWGSKVIAPRILDLGSRWRRVVSFTSGRLTPSERTPGTHWIGGWVGPRAGLDTVSKRNISASAANRTPMSIHKRNIEQAQTSGNPPD